MKKGMTVILSGPSGAGKSSIVAKAMEGRSDLCFSTSATTRAPREGERDGVDYFFVTQERFNEMIEMGELLEHAEYVSHCYGTPKAFVEERLLQGQHVVLDIEICGARQVREKMPEALTIFVAPPSLKLMRERLEKRGSESRDVIDARIARARQEIKEADFYDYLIINDDLERAAAEFSAILDAAGCRFERARLEQVLSEE